MDLLFLQKKLRLLRQVSYTPVSEICDYVGITRQTLKNLEDGKYTANKRLLNTILNYYHSKAQSSPQLMYWISEVLNSHFKEEIHLNLRNIKEILFNIQDYDLTEHIRRKVLSRKKPSSRLLYSYILFEEILQSISEISNSILKEEHLKAKRYFLKPLIEDFVNLSNLFVYGKDYMKAININNLRELLQPLRREELLSIYNQLGDTLTNLDIDNARTKQREWWHEIENPQIKKLVTTSNGDINFALDIQTRFEIYNSPKVSKELMVGLYDYVNNFSHLNLYYIRKGTGDSDTFSEEITRLLEQILSESLHYMGEIFGIQQNRIDTILSIEDEELLTDSEEDIYEYMSNFDKFEDD